MSPLVYPQIFGQRSFPAMWEINGSESGIQSAYFSAVDPVKAV